MNAPGTVVVLGAGRMGAGIAHSFLLAGSTVHLRDVNEVAVKRGRETLKRSLEIAAERSTSSISLDEVFARLLTGVGIEPFPDTELVVEAVPESLSLKRAVWAELSENSPRSAVFASNTSSISIGELAEEVAEPGRFIGMHFFNPVPVSKLVELVRGALTSDDTTRRVVGWIEAIGKHSIVAADVPGFATSRLGLAMGLEAVRMLEDGVASAEDIDRGMELGYGLPMGPLKLTDVVGLDVRLEIAEYLSGRLGERFTPPALLRSMVERGDLGRKSGKGFYEW